MTPEDFEVHETGTRKALDEKEILIQRLQRETYALRGLLRITLDAIVEDFPRFHSSISNALDEVDKN